MFIDGHLLIVYTRKKKKKICHAMRLQVIRQHVLVVTSNMYTPETVSYTEYMSAAYDY